MRLSTTLCLAALLCVTLAHAQVVNGGFEEGRQMAQAPAPGWSLKGDQMPAGWDLNGSLPGTVGLVPDAYTGKSGLFLASGKGESHMSQGMWPVKSGEVLQFSIWIKTGRARLAGYEYAGNKWLRTTPNLTVLKGTGQWTQGGGYYRCSDPEVTAFRVVLIGDDPAGAVLDDLEVKAVPVQTRTGADVVLENQGLRLTLGPDGSLQSFFDKTAGEERTLGPGRPFLGATLGSWSLPPSRVERQGNLLQVTFGENQAKATIECQELPYVITFKLKSWEPQELGDLTLADFSLKKLTTVGAAISAEYDERIATGLMAFHYAGSQSARRTAQTTDFRCSFPGARGLDRAACAVFACPRARLEQTIQEAQAAGNLPAPRIEGVWGKQSSLVHRSYFFIHDLSEANVDEVIAWGKRGRFAYIQILEDAWSHGGGTFAINERNFPHGRDGLKAVVAKLHDAGFKVGLHFLAAGQRGSDPLVSPVPNDGLAYGPSVALAGAVDEKADFLPTTAPPTAFPEEDGGYEGSGTVLRLGDEIIFYGARKLDPPYGFVNCRRGYLSSKPTAHAAGDNIRHMMKSYGLFLTDADSPLMDQVAQNVAATFKYCGLDGLYFDGSERLQGDHNYYNARIQMAYANACGTRNLICQGSSFSTYTWNLVSRMASADGYKDIKFYLDERSPSFISWYDANLMPIDIGWYGMNPNIRPDDIEYIMSRAIGFNASVSISTGLEALHSTPQSGEMMDLVARWEELRRSGRVPDKIRERLREKGREYTLEQRGGDDLLIPIQYLDWAGAPGPDGNVETLTLKNSRAGQPRLEVQLESGACVQPGADYESGQALELFEAAPTGGEGQPLGTNQFDPATHGHRATRQGVTQELTLVTDDVKEGKAALRFRATSTLTDRGGWATFGKDFPAPLNLGNYGVIGLWVKGDAKGELLKVQLWDTAGKPQDQYITIDFNGWRFIELPRPKPALIDHTKVARIHFYYNAMPANTTSECILDGVKVMAQPTVLTNPAVLVGQTKVTFPVTMAAGDRIVLRGGGECWLYRRGEDKQRIAATGELPPFSEGLTVSGVPTTHALRVRAALSWPDLALRVPAK